MGSSQSSLTKNGPSKKNGPSPGERGRKSFMRSAPYGLKASVVSIPSEHLEQVKKEVAAECSVQDFDKLAFAEVKAEDDTESTDTDYEEYVEDEEWEERLRILEEARMLKQVAEYFLHPEVPVTSNTSSRCYFDRTSAPERLTKEEADERSAVLSDAAALKELAVDYMHPEHPVVTTDPNACGRNYFTRASAPEQESLEDAAEYDLIFEDMKVLKQAAMDYMHPELPVVTTDGTAYGRNYFTRPSAPAFETTEDAGEYARSLEDVKKLKKFAVDYMHPELPVVTSDPTACGRNYFARPSAPQYESSEEAQIRSQILMDAIAFKQLATDYMHPELPTVIYATATGRNYFSRESAPEYESLEDAEARARVMDDFKAFKKLAVDFLHPELPTVIYATSYGRNYFSRPSALEQESLEDAQERAAILEDSKALKKLAVDYLHPELPVVTSDPTACARCFFDRPSASEQESLEDAQERAAVLEDMKALKQAAVDYMHPELHVVTSDPIAYGRNYFSRASAPQQESLEDTEERAAILEDMKALKQAAVDYLHPELPVVTSDPTACARCFFDRPSAPEEESLEDAQERAAVLEDMKALKQAAVDYMHPELPVVTSDPYACARCFFDRPSKLHDVMIHSFPAHEDDEYHEHHEVHDVFGMDEDLHFYSDLRAKLSASAVPGEANRSKLDSEVGSNLSRSPSSVMLFQEEAYD